MLVSCVLNLFLINAKVEDKKKTKIKYLVHIFLYIFINIGHQLIFTEI